MAEVIFKYHGEVTIIQCKIEDIMKEICEKYVSKVQKDIKKLMFIYGGGLIDLNLKYEEVANEIDKQNLKMNILVYDNNNLTTLDEKDRIIKSKDVICPRCREICLLDFREYKAILENCRNKHESILTLDEYENTRIK